MESLHYWLLALSWNPLTISLVVNNTFRWAYHYPSSIMFLNPPINKNTLMHCLIVKFVYQKLPKLHAVTKPVLVTSQQLQHLPCEIQPLLVPRHSSVKPQTGPHSKTQEEMSNKTSGLSLIEIIRVNKSKTNELQSTLYNQFFSSLFLVTL